MPRKEDHNEICAYLKWWFLGYVSVVYKVVNGQISGNSTVLAHGVN